MYDQLLRPTTDRTINRDGRRPLVRSIVASCDRSYEQSWHPACDRSYEHSSRWHPVTERTINRDTRRPIVRSLVGCNHRSIVASYANCCDTRPTVRSVVASCDRSYDQSCDYGSAIIHNWWCHHARLVARSRSTYLQPLTTWNRRLQVLHMIIELVATDIALAITHDLYDQSYELYAICPRFQHFSVAGRS